MNVYDFDKTIYSGDSTIDFYCFCLLKNPRLVKYLPKQIKGFCQYKLRIISKKEFKELFFSFLQDIDDIPDEVCRFWDKNITKMKDWYLEQKKEDDVVVSASPTFLLQEICNREGIQHLIATGVEATTGKFVTENCYGEEKVKRFRETYPDSIIDNFFSDSKSDEPMAQIANKAFIVRKSKIKKW